MFLSLGSLSSPPVNRRRRQGSLPNEQFVHSIDIPPRASKALFILLRFILISDSMELPSFFECPPFFSENESAGGELSFPGRMAKIGARALVN